MTWRQWKKWVKWKLLEDQHGGGGGGTWGAIVGGIVGITAAVALSATLGPAGFLLLGGAGAGLGGLIGEKTDWGTFASLFTIDIPDMGASYGDSLVTGTNISAPVPIAFGKIKTAGNLVRSETQGSKDTYRAYIVCFCQGEIDSYDSVYVNDILWANLTEGYTHTKTEYTGTFTQTADGRFTNQAQAYRGAAYIAYTLYHTKKGKGRPPNMQVMNPNFTVILSGTKCTPIAGGADAFTRNPAVILWHIYTKLEGRDTSELDQTAFQALETYCDAVPDGGTLPRYRFDFIFDASTTINDMKKYVFKSFNGACIWSFDTSGNSVLKPVWYKSSDPIYSFDQDNIVAGSFSWTQPQNKPNIIKVNYINSADDYKKDFMEMRDETSISANGEIDFDEVAYFLTDEELVSRRARFIYSKFKYTDYSCKLKGFPESSKLEVFDTVRVTHTLPGWSNKQFVITGKREDANGLCEFDLDAYHSAIHEDRPAEIQHDYSSTLPNPFATPVGVKNLVLTESSVTGADGIYVPTVLVNFDPPTTTDSIYWHHGEIWTKTSDSGTTWAYYGNSIGGSTYTIDGIRAGFWGYTQGGVTVDVAVRSMHATVHAGFIAQDLESATSASENIDELPTGYFTVHPTIGKAMFSTVSNAIAALPANGGEIKLLEGTHRVGSGVSMPNKDVYIYGAGSGVTVRPSPGDPGFQIHNKTKRYRFSNFTIHSRNVFPAGYDYIIDVRGSGSCSANNTADLEIDNMRIILQDRGNPSFSPAGDYGIFAQYGSGSFSVRDTTVEGGAYGILLQYQNNIQIMGCHVKGTLDAGISVQVDTDSRCIVSNNFVSDYYTLGIAVGAGTPSGVTGAIIANNQIVLGTGAWSGAGATQGINVGGNKVHVGNNYIQMVNSEDVAGVGVVGIRVQYSKAGNLISNNKIVISMDTTVALNGITQAGVSNSIVSNNAVEVLNNDHTAESFGIKFTNCYANVVSNNNVLMSNDANDIGIDTDDGTCRYNYGVGNKTYLVGANDISANDSITIDDD